MHAQDQLDHDHADLAPPPPPRRVTASRSGRGGRSAWFWPAVGLAAAGAAVVAFALTQGGNSDAGSAPNPLVTSFMPGEIQRLPAACSSVPGSVLDQYVPGRSNPVAAQPLVGKAATQCSWTVDQPTRYQFMELAVEAYEPSGLASGNGSATEAAQDAFVGGRLAKQFPPQKAAEPKAVVTAVSGLGQEAFSADQHFKRGIALDMVTLVARYRNVLVTVVFEARTGGRFGGDPIAALTAGAQAVARAALAGIG